MDKIGKVGKLVSSEMIDPLYLSLFASSFSPLPSSNTRPSAQGSYFYAAFVRAPHVGRDACGAHLRASGAYYAFSVDAVPVDGVPVAKAALERCSD